MLAMVNDSLLKVVTRKMDFWKMPFSTKVSWDRSEVLQVTKHQEREALNGMCGEQHFCNILGCHCPEWLKKQR